MGSLEKIAKIQNPIPNVAQPKPSANLNGVTPMKTGTANPFSLGGQTSAAPTSARHSQFSPRHSRESGNPQTNNVTLAKAGDSGSLLHLWAYNGRLEPWERGRLARRAALARSALILGRVDTMNLTQWREGAKGAEMRLLRCYSRYFYPVIPAKAGIHKPPTNPAAQNQVRIEASGSLLPSWEKARMRVSRASSPRPSTANPAAQNQAPLAAGEFPAKQPIRPKPNPLCALRAFAPLRQISRVNMPTSY